MKNKIILIGLLSGLTCIANAQEPDESGIGGTGRSSEPETLFDFFSKPDLPERVNIPDAPVAVEIPALENSGADLSSPVDSAPSIPTAGATGAGSTTGAPAQ